MTVSISDRERPRQWTHPVMRHRGGPDDMTERSAWVAAAFGFTGFAEEETVIVIAGPGGRRKTNS